MTQPKPRPKPVVLCILDGWGISPVTEGNAVAGEHAEFRPHHTDLPERDLDNPWP